MGKQEGTRKLAYRILTSDAPGKIDAIRFVQQCIRPYATVHTDGSVIHRYAPIYHTMDIHNKFEFTNTSEIEGMFGILRTFIRRMYHHVTPEKFPELMGEFYWRFSHREVFISPYQYLTKTLRLVPTG